MGTFETAFILASALGLGALHAFEVDHMTAVGAFVADRPKRGQALWFGVKWALGHALSLVLFGSLLFALKLAVADDVNHWFERTVGFALVVVGLVSLSKLRATGVAHMHNHGAGSFWMGMLHGVAGTAAFVGQSLVVLAKSYPLALAYTLSFSVGVLLVMAIYAMFLGGLLSWAGTRSQVMAQGARAAVGLWSCGVGLFWMFR